MKNYQSVSLINELSRKFDIKGRTITITGDVGIKTWGKLDYMKKCGYSVTRGINK
jgi:hypothetical protein